MAITSSKTFQNDKIILNKPLKKIKKKLSVKLKLSKTIEIEESIKRNLASTKVISPLFKLTLLVLTISPQNVC